MPHKNKQIPQPGHRLRRAFALYCVLGMAVCLALPAYAAADPLAVINNLSDFVFAIVKGRGFIMMGFGVMQVGMSFQSHDPSQRSNGFLALAGGIIIYLAKDILDLILA